MNLRRGLFGVLVERRRLFVARSFAADIGVISNSTMAVFAHSDGAVRQVTVPHEGVVMRGKFSFGPWPSRWLPPAGDHDLAVMPLQDVSLGIGFTPLAPERLGGPRPSLGARW